MADLRQIIVDTDSAYSGFDYATLATAESNEQGDLVASGVYMVFECYATAGTADGNVTFDGWTTSGSEYVEVNGLLDSSYGHRGVWDDNEYRIVEASGEDCIDNYEAHFRVTGLQLHNNNAASIKMGIRDFESSDATAQKYHSYNLIKGSSSATYNMRGISISLATGGVSRVFNNIIYDVNTAATSHGVYVSGGTNYVYNNTILGGTFGVYRNDGTGIIINNLCQNQVTSAIEFSGSIDTSSGYNVIEDPTLVADSASGTGVDLTTGTATSYTANKLNDTGAGLSVAVVGSVVVNTTDVTYAKVTVVDSDTQLTLSADIFDTGNEAYRVTSNIHGTPDFQAGTYLLTTEDTLAMFHGVNKYADASLPVTDDILGNSRGSSSTDNFDIGAHHSLQFNRIVDTDSTYTGYDYTTLISAESNEQADLTATGLYKIAVFECYATSGTADTAQVNIDGWITEPTNYIEVTGMNDAAEYHNGVWDVTKYRLTNINSSAFVVTEEHVRVTGLQIQQSNTTSTRQPIVTSNASQADTHFEFSYNLLKGNGGSSYAQHGIRLEGTNAGQVVLIWNNIIFDTSTFSTSYGIRSNHSGTTYAYNNTIIGGTSGLNRNAGTTYFVNNITQGQASSGVSWAGRVSDKTGWNVVDDATLIADSMGGSNTDLTTGTATSYGANKLNDSGGGLSVAVVGSVVANTTDNTYADVTVVDSDIQLTLSSDIFDTGNETYRVGSNIYGVVDFNNATGDDFSLSYLDEVAMFNGTNLYADADSPITDDILGNSRGAAATDTYDVGAHHSLEYGKVVDPDSGAGYDYTTITTFESSEQADITVSGLNKISVATCRSTGGSADTISAATTIAFAGWTTSNSNYIKWWTDPTEAYRHQGIYSSSYYRVEKAEADVTLVSLSENIVVDGIQFKITKTGSSSYLHAIDCTTSSYTDNIIQISNNIVMGVYSGTDGEHIGIRTNWLAGSDTRTIKIWNNIVYDWTDTNSKAMSLNNGWTSYVHNNTIHNSYYGLYNNESDCDIINNIIMDCTTPKSGSFLTDTNNITTDVLFNDETADVFTLDYLDRAAIFSGINLYTDSNLPVTDDILGNSRGSALTDAFDVGAHHSLEYGHVIDPDEGAGSDYASLNIWESNEQADITISGLNKIAIATCRSTGGTNDTTATTINGWTTGDGNYIKVWTDPDEAYRHPGYWIAGNYYRLVVSNSSAINVQETDWHFEGLQIMVSGIDATDQDCILSNPGSVVTVARQKILKNVFKGKGSHTSNDYHFGFQAYDYQAGSSGKIEVYNNIMYNFGSSSDGYANGGVLFYADGGTALYGMDCYVYNNTFYECSRAMMHVGTGAGTTVSLKNNLSESCHRVYRLENSAVFTDDSSHNAWTGTPVSDGAFGASHASGVTDGTTSGKLVDVANGDFINSGVQIDDIVKNTTDSNYTAVSAVDSATVLALYNDNFISGEGYIIYTNMQPNAFVFQDEGNDKFLLDSTDTGAKNKGKNLSADSNLSFTDDILGALRP